jgi:hypothetical protein
MQASSQCRNNSWSLHHDSAPTHTSFILQQLFASTEATVIPNPPSLPDLTPYNFFPISKNAIEA